MTTALKAHKNKSVTQVQANKRSELVTLHLPVGDSTNKSVTQVQAKQTELVT